MAHPKPKILTRQPVRVCVHCGLKKNAHQPRTQRCPMLHGQWGTESTTRFTAGPPAVNPQPEEGSQT